MTDHEEWDRVAKETATIIDSGNQRFATKRLLLLVRYGLKIRLSDYGADRLISLINKYLVKYYGG
jgi:hypothetical protein